MPRPFRAAWTDNDGGTVREHRLWGREYGDGETVTLGGASAGGGPFPAQMNNYFVLFADARPGLEELYALTSEGELQDDLWALSFSVSDASGHTQTLNETIAEIEDARKLGIFVRHPDADGATVEYAPIWEIFELSIDFLDAD